MREMLKVIFKLKEKLEIRLVLGTGRRLNSHVDEPRRVANLPLVYSTLPRLDACDREKGNVHPTCVAKILYFWLKTLQDFSLAYAWFIDFNRHAFLFPCIEFCRYKRQFCTAVQR